MADRMTGRKRPLFTLSQGDVAPEETREDSIGPLRVERASRDERVDRVGREERVDRIGRDERVDRFAREDRTERATRDERAVREERQERPEPRRKRALDDEAHAVRIVDIDVPFTSLAYLFIKLLVVLIPFVAALGLALRFVWKLVAG
jgi:hypothetical protein